MKIVRGMCLLLVLLPCPAAFAQFRDLATTDDGEQFYFSSALRVKGTEDLTSEKILRYVGSHFETFRQIPCEIQLSRSNHCEQTEPQVSSDGRVVANTANGWCSGGSRCIGYVQFSGAIAGADVPAGATLWNGYVRMSRNARFIARLGADTWIPYNPSNEFIDLVQGTYARLPQLSLLGTQAISDDGSLLARDSTGPLLWRSGTQQRLHFSSIPQMGGAQLSANGRLIVYEGLVEARCQAVSYEVAREREIPLGAIPCRHAIRRSILSLSNDGSLVLYPSPEPNGASEWLMLQSTAGGTARVLMQSASGISEAVLSGDGSVAYAATPAGGLLKIRVSTGEIQELSKPAVVFPSNYEIAPGMRLELPRKPFKTASVDVKLLIAGRDAPLLTMDEDRVVFQVPWEVEPDQPSRLQVPDDSLFEQGLSANPAWGLPGFYFLPEPGYPEYSVPVAAHEDFRTLVTRQSPARRGEIIHLYFTGLGRVSPPIATGEITPAEPLRYLHTPFACRYNVAMTYHPIELLFVGLAPGFIGVNQVDMRVPEAAASPEFQFECVSTQRVGWNTGYATLPVAP